MPAFHNLGNRVICAKGFPWDGNFRLRYSPDHTAGDYPYREASEVHLVPPEQGRELVEQQQPDVCRPPLPTSVPDLGESLRAAEGISPAVAAA